MIISFIYFLMRTFLWLFSDFPDFYLLDTWWTYFNATSTQLKIFVIFNCIVFKKVDKLISILMNRLYLDF